MGEPILRVEGISLAYGHIVALRDVSLKIEEGEAVAILGANGAGKSSLIKTMMGWQKPRSGRIFWRGTDITRLPPWERARLGMAVVPEGGRVFRDMSVEDNLKLGAFLANDRREIAEGMERVFSLFPILKERRKQVARTLSGGEQQMLAIGRAVMLRPKLLLVDEVSMGLAPILVEEVFAALARLHREGTSICLVEQNAHEALQVVERGYVLENGRIALSGSAGELSRVPGIQAAYLGSG